MPTKVEELITRFSVDDKYTAAVKKISNETKKIQSAAVGGKTGSGSTGGMGGFFDGFAGSLRFAASEMDSALPGLQEVLGILKVIAITAGAAGIAMVGLGAHAMKTAADMEALKLGLRAYSDTQEDFERTLKRLQEVARLPGLGFMEAIQGSTRLQAAGLDARLAERALLGFGNALAAVGGGKDELDGVLLALTQIATKSSVSAEEINQIAERVPQIRQLMLQAFGTANTESLAKMGIGSQEFILEIIDALGTLPKALGGAKNAFENFEDIAIRIFADIGQALNDHFLPPLSRIADFFGFLQENEFFSKVSKGILSAIGGMDTFEKMVIRTAAFLAAAFERLPEIVGKVMDFVRDKIESARQGFNEFIKSVNQLLGGIEQIMNGRVGRLLRGDSSRISFSRIPEISDPAKSKLGDPIFGQLFGDIGDRADELLSEFDKFKASQEAANDPSKGGFTFSAHDSLAQIAKSSRETAANTQALKEIKDLVLGGTGRGDLSPVEMRTMKRGKKNSVRRLLDDLASAIYQDAHGAVMESLLSRASRGM